jgi:hypothetical protein
VLQQKKGTSSWFWKGVLAAGAGVLIMTLAAKKSDSVKAGSMRAADWMDDKVERVKQAMQHRCGRAVVYEETAPVSNMAKNTAQAARQVGEEGSKLLGSYNEQRRARTVLADSSMVRKRPRRLVARPLYRKSP